MAPLGNHGLAGVTGRSVIPPAGSPDGSHRQAYAGERTHQGSSSFAVVVARVRSPVPDFGGPGRFLLIAAARPAEDVVALPVIPVSRVAVCEQ